MALTVGEDSYVTLEEADSLINKNYTSTSRLMVKWNSLSVNDKECMLRTSCRDINNLKLRGKRARTNQTLEFPRSVQTMSGYGYTLYVSQFTDNQFVSADTYSGGGLKEVKEAQVENALYHADLDDLVSEQVGVNIQGITSKKAGPIAETYNTDNRYNRNAAVGIYTDKVYSLLVCWLNDSRANI